MPPYRIRLDRSITSTRRIEVRKFKFRVQVWTVASPNPTTIHAALDSFADYSVLPTRMLVQQGGIVPPAAFAPGSSHGDASLDFAFCDAPPPLNKLRFASDPCRFDARLSTTHRFQLSLRDIVPHLGLELEEDRHGELWLLLTLRAAHGGKPV